MIMTVEPVLLGLILDLCPLVLDLGLLKNTNKTSDKRILGYGSIHKVSTRSDSDKSSLNLQLDLQVYSCSDMQMHFYADRRPDLCRKEGVMKHTHQPLSKNNQ